MGRQLRARGAAAGVGQRPRHRPDLRRGISARGPLLRLRARRRRQPLQASEGRSARPGGGVRDRGAAGRRAGRRTRPARCPPRHQARQRPDHLRRPRQGGRTSGSPACSRRTPRARRRSSARRRTWPRSRPTAAWEAPPPTSTARASCSTRCSPGTRRSRPRPSVELALRHVQDPPPPLPDETPEPLVEIVDRALQKEPAERYRDGRALARALNMAREELPDEDLPAQRPAVRTGAVGLLEREVGTSTTAPISRTAATGRRPPGRSRRGAEGSTPPRRRALPGTRIGNPISSRRNVNPAERRQRIAIFVCVLALVGGMIAAALAIAPEARHGAEPARDELRPSRPPPPTACICG